MQEWWRRAVVYQIYPKSFYDTNADGIGDLRGIIEKLDYLQELGVDVLWLNPIYCSPQRDNGYDISDYYSINPEYGTMEDFEELLEQAHRRGMKVMLDMVVNHTSTEHAWFQEARQSKDNPRRDYYIWKDKPNNWQSKFGGNAWEWDKKTQQYYLHLFDKTQADLNWENPKMRQEIYQMMRWWLDKGVDGFRLDVINLLSKDQRFLDDGSTPPGDGRKYYTDGPRIHEFLQEINREVFSHYDMTTVGEMSSTSIPHCIRYTNPENRELDMVFQFHHLKVDYPQGEKWTKAEFDFQKLKEILSTWQVEMQKGGGWNALFWCNHDQPRIVSRFGDDGRYRVESAKMLATTIHLMQGTPYIYQGEEIGMTNPNFQSIEQYRDVETKSFYQILKEKGVSESEVLEIIAAKSRDNSRTPMQWDDSEHAGFTKGTPWIEVAENYPEINVEVERNRENSIFQHYQQLIRLRKEMDLVTTGEYQLLLPDHPDLFVYLRKGEKEHLLVINNFRAYETTFELTDELDWNHYHSEILLSNYEDTSNLNLRMNIRPYESIVYHLTKKDELDEEKEISNR